MNNHEQALRAIGVSRDAESPGGKSLLVAFNRKPTDDELRHVHDTLAALQRTEPPAHKAIQDAIDYGTGVYRINQDGTTKHIPHADLYAEQPEAAQDERSRFEAWWKREGRFTIRSKEKCFGLWQAAKCDAAQQSAWASKWHRLVISLGCLFDFDTSGSVDEIAKAAADKRDAAQSNTNVQKVNIAQAQEQELHDRIAKALDLSHGSVNGKRIVFAWDYLIGLIEDLQKAVDAQEEAQERAAVTDAMVMDVALKARRAMESECERDFIQQVPYPAMRSFVRSLLSLSAQSSEREG